LVCIQKILVTVLFYLTLFFRVCANFWASDSKLKIGCEC
jgi:hypothetical protein